MNLISRMVWGTCGFALLLAHGSGATAETTRLIATTPVYESKSSGLITFSSADAAIRVAVAMVEADEATVDTVVNFIDADGTVLKQQRGTLRQREPIIAELTRRDVGGRNDVLVRVQVIHKLPGVRDREYPIRVTLQPIAGDGSARFVVDWPGGECGCPTCGSSTGHGRHAYCPTTLPEGY